MVIILSFILSDKFSDLVPVCASEIIFQPHIYVSKIIVIYLVTMDTSV